MRTIKAKFGFLMLLSLSAFGGCKKKDSAAKKNTSEQLEITKPEENLDTAVASLASAMDTDIAETMVSSLALPLTSKGFTLDDCDEHAEPLARSGDDASYKDNSGRLRLNHPRMPLQDFYCKMQKDTGAPDSFIGALSQGKMLFCFMGTDLVFDGTERERTLDREAIIACLGDTADEEMKEETLSEIGDSVVAKITASAPAAFGDKDSWDGSVKFVAELKDSTVTLRILLKNSDNILAIANLSGAGRDEDVDAYVVAINSETGEVRYEAKFQRIRSLDGTSSNGWNRHAVAYVKGTMNDDLIFTETTGLNGAYSDISVNNGDNNPTDADAPVTYGTLWTVAGTTADGIRTQSYEPSCTQSGDTRTCDDVNLASTWVATDGANACNGALTGTTCAGEGLKLTANAHTAFMMDLKNDDFQSTEDWFDALKVPDFTDVTLTINQK